MFLINAICYILFFLLGYRIAKSISRRAQLNMKAVVLVVILSLLMFAGSPALVGDRADLINIFTYGIKLSTALQMISLGAIFYGLAFLLRKRLSVKNGVRL